MGDTRIKVEGEKDWQDPTVFDRMTEDKKTDSSAVADTEASSMEEQVMGFWKSEKGECRIFRDKNTNQLSYEELIGDGSERLHGRMMQIAEEASEKAGAGVVCWEAELMILEEDDGPWYGPSYGPKPDVVGSIRVRFSLGSPSSLDTRIKVEGKKDWQDPT